MRPRPFPRATGRAGRGSSLCGGAWRRPGLGRGRPRRGGRLGRGRRGGGGLLSLGDQELDPLRDARRPELATELEIVRFGDRTGRSLRPKNRRGRGVLAANS